MAAAGRRELHAHAWSKTEYLRTQPRILRVCAENHGRHQSAVLMNRKLKLVTSKGEHFVRGEIGRIHTVSSMPALSPAHATARLALLVMR